MTRAEFEIPGSFPSVANLREHWAAKARRAKKHREAAEWGTVIAMEKQPGLVDEVRANGGRVTLTRYAPRQLDTDNCSSALKNVRDGIAAVLRVDDGDPRVVWNYAQERCPNGQQRVRAVVEAARERA
jgi:hypothetical protein